MALWIPARVIGNSFRLDALFGEAPIETKTDGWSAEDPLPAWLGAGREGREIRQARQLVLDELAAV